MPLMITEYVREKRTCLACGTQYQYIEYDEAATRKTENKECPACGSPRSRSDWHRD
jgi:rRNA maturation endonuclease Nob1